MKRILRGPRAVGEALGRRDARQQLAVLYIDGAARRTHRTLVEQARARDIRIEEVGRAQLDALSRGQRHQGIVAVGGDYPYIDLDELLERAPSSALLLALDEVTDPQNFGAIVRSAVALGADGIVLPKRRSAGVTSAVVRVSAGATEHARIARVTNLALTLSSLQNRGLQIVGLAAEGETAISELPSAAGGRVLVVGSEGRGLRRLVRQSCNVLAHIPLVGPLGSLNASVAAAIALYEAARHRSDS